jgi:Ser/Thr protein kinase RdoA (MazF antagonist)
MMVQSAWGNQETQFFYSLTPEKVLDAVEASLGKRCTGRTMAHASMENRVYEIELDIEDRKRGSLEHLVIAKFYRPGRWSREQILEEHAYLRKLEEVEIPVVAPMAFMDGQTLHKMKDSGIFYAIFPKVGGRSPQELNREEATQIGRLLGRMHNVGASLPAKHRLQLTPEIYLHQNFQFLLREHLIPESLRNAFSDLVHRLGEKAKGLWAHADRILIHGDCHLGNLLQNGSSFFWVDFDDCIIGPAVQDLWLLLPGRDHYAQDLMHHLLDGYEQMRPFDRGTLRMIEMLRAFRMIHFAAWIARRREDPAFQRAFHDWGTDRYWQQLYQDLLDQEDFAGREYIWD